MVGALVAACSTESNSVQCADGRTCPEGTVCDDNHALCVLDDQLEQCSGKEDRAQCSFAETTGSCDMGVCLEIGCGNGRLDLREADVCASGTCIADFEVCDDGNNRDGDGCAGNCLSDEICGNRTIDVSRGELCDDGGLLDHDGCSSTCEVEYPRWVPTVSPGPLAQARAVYDVARGKVVIVGGRIPIDSDATRDIATAAVSEYGDGVWHSFIPSPVSPTPPSVNVSSQSDFNPLFGLAYDIERRLTVLAGGHIPSPTKEVWGWDGTTWQRLPDLPIPLEGIAIAYDRKRKRLVTFGGRNKDNDNNSINHDDMFELTADATAWTSATPPAKPSARSDATLAYDPKRGVLVLHGGDFTSNVGDEIWEFDGTTWQNKLAHSAGQIPSQLGPSMAFDSESGQMVILDDTNTNGADMYFWNGTTLTKFTGPMPIATPTLASGPGTPTTIRYAAMLVEDGRGRLMIYGGQTEFQNSEPSRLLRDRLHWFFETGNWTLAPAPARGVILACYATLMNEGKVVRYGGNPGVSSTAAVAETWEQTSRGWTVFTGGSPPALEVCGLAHDPERKQLLLFGGETNNGSVQTATNETWIREGTGWTRKDPVGNWPAPRIGHGLAYDGARKEIVMFGGRAATAQSSTRFADTWIWDGTTWIQRSPVTSPATRSGSAMAYDPVGRVVVLFGGSPGQNDLDSETWIWDGTTWTDLTPMLDESPAERDFASLVWNPARQTLVLTSDNTLFSAYIDFWEWKTTSLSPYKGQWQRVSTPTRPPRHLFGGAFTTLDGSGISYGFGYNQTALDDVWELRMDATGSDTCRGPIDGDGDGLTTCADPDCWRVCTPDCPPGTSCPAMDARCGDGTCSSIETCRTCPGDCPTCNDTRCGDAFCDPGETCPGDCP